MIYSDLVMGIALMMAAMIVLLAVMAWRGRPDMAFAGPAAAFKKLFDGAKDICSNTAKLMQSSVNTYMDVGLPGQLADIGPHDIVTKINTSGAAIGFGLFVTKGSTDGSAVLPDATGEVTGKVGLGVTVRTLHIVSGTGYADKGAMSVIKKGRVYVQVEDDVIAETAAFVRFVAGDGEQLGAFRSDADTADAVALPGAKFVTDASAGGIAVLDLNLP